VVRGRAGYVRTVHYWVRLVLAGACLVAAACGTGGSAPTDPLAGLSARQVVDKAVANLRAAPTAGISGTVSDTTGTYHVDLEYKKASGCQGTVSVNGKGSYELIRVGTTAWVKPDDAFWRANAGAQAQQVIAVVGGKYLKGDTSNATVASLAKLCDLNALTEPLLQPTNIVKGGVTTLGGQRVLPIKDMTKGGELFVTDTSTPHPVEVSNKSAGATGMVTFRVGNPVTLTPPPANQVIDGAQFGF